MAFFLVNFPNSSPCTFLRQGRTLVVLPIDVPLLPHFYFASLAHVHPPYCLCCTDLVSSTQQCSLSFTLSFFKNIWKCCGKCAKFRTCIKSMHFWGAFDFEYFAKNNMPLLPNSTKAPDFEGPNHTPPRYVLNWFTNFHEQIMFA